jgi:hypothetical protein
MKERITMTIEMVEGDWRMRRVIEDMVHAHQCLKEAKVTNEMIYSGGFRHKFIVTVGRETLQLFSDDGFKLLSLPNYEDHLYVYSTMELEAKIAEFAKEVKEGTG